MLFALTERVQINTSPNMLQDHIMPLHSSVGAYYTMVRTLVKYIVVQRYLQNTVKCNTGIIELLLARLVYP